MKCSYTNPLQMTMHSYIIHCIRLSLQQVQGYYFGRVLKSPMMVDERRHYKWKQSQSRTSPFKTFEFGG